MPVFPDNDGTKWLTDPANLRKDANGKVVRVVVHTTAAGMTLQDQAGSAYNTWTSASERERMGVGMVSAHFCVELDGRVIQFVDTKDIAFGTGWLTGTSVHIEFAGIGPNQLLEPQLQYGSNLIAWIAKAHPDVALDPTGVSEADPGDPTKPGITCHKFIQVVWRAKPENKTAKFTPKDCPGTGVIGQLPNLARLAKLRLALLNTPIAPP